MASVVSDSESSGSVFKKLYNIRDDQVEEWEALKNLVWYGSREIKGKRLDYEKSGGQTYIQMIMAGYEPPTENDSDEYKRLPPQIDDMEKFIEERGWFTFKKYYSWFTAVKMHRDENMELTDNEDEHVLPVGFMLLFGGGLAKRMIMNSMMRDREVYSQVLEQGIDQWMKTTQGQEHMTKLQYITEEGKDIELLETLIHSRQGVNGQALDLLNCIYGDDDKRIRSFLLIQMKLNYYGYFLSEAKANRIKSDYIFVKLVKSNGEDERNKGDIYFTSSVSSIEQFVREIHGFYSAYNVKEVKKLEQGVRDRESKKKEGMNSQGQEIFYSRNAFTSRWFPTSSGSIEMHSNMDVDAAVKNMKYVIDRLVQYLNMGLRDRIFFNIVMSELYLEDKEKTLAVGGKFASPVARLFHALTRQKTIQEKGEGQNVRSPNRNEIPISAKSPGGYPPGEYGASSLRIDDSDEEKESIATMQTIPETQELVEEQFKVISIPLGAISEDYNPVYDDKMEVYNMRESFKNAVKYSSIPELEEDDINELKIVYIKQRNEGDEMVALKLPDRFNHKGEIMAYINEKYDSVDFNVGHLSTNSLATDVTEKTPEEKKLEKAEQELEKAEKEVEQKAINEAHIAFVVAYLKDDDNKDKLHRLEEYMKQHTKTNDKPPRLVQRLRLLMKIPGTGAVSKGKRKVRAEGGSKNKRSKKKRTKKKRRRRKKKTRRRR